jgi:hypothetical protein
MMFVNLYIFTHRNDNAYGRLYRTCNYYFHTVCTKHIDTELILVSMVHGLYKRKQLPSKSGIEDLFGFPRQNIGAQVV